MRNAIARNWHVGYIYSVCYQHHRLYIASASQESRQEGRGTLQQDHDPQEQRHVHTKAGARQHQRDDQATSAEMQDILPFFLLLFNNNIFFITEQVVIPWIKTPLEPMMAMYFPVNFLKKIFSFTTKVLLTTFRCSFFSPSFCWNRCVQLRLTMFSLCISLSPLVLFESALHAKCQKFSAISKLDRITTCRCYFKGTWEDRISHPTGSFLIFILELQMLDMDMDADRSDREWEWEWDVERIIVRVHPWWQPFVANHLPFFYNILAIK